VDPKTDVAASCPHDGSTSKGIPYWLGGWNATGTRNSFALCSPRHGEVKIGGKMGQANGGLDPKLHKAATA
jgi:hypothetical protein